ncbi:MAG: hypothetical protein RIC87_19975 [Kiloniellales bacterium]
MRESTAAHADLGDGGYGYMRSIAGGQLGELGSYAASGYLGHWAYEIPKAKLVVVHRADTFGERFVLVSLGMPARSRKTAQDLPKPCVID